MLASGLQQLPAAGKHTRSNLRALTQPASEIRIKLDNHRKHFSRRVFVNAMVLTAHLHLVIKVLGYNQRLMVSVHNIGLNSLNPFDCGPIKHNLLTEGGSRIIAWI